MTVLKKLNIIKVKENVPVSEKENTSVTKDSVNISSSESKMNTSPAINPAIQCCGLKPVVQFINHDVILERKIVIIDVTISPITPHSASSLSGGVKMGFRQ